MELHTSISNHHSSFRAHGKLLLTGEYLVLHGALALAIPLHKGQTLQVNEGSFSHFEWKAFHPSGLWFSVTFDEDLTIQTTNDHPKAEKLKNILKTALQIKNASSSYLQGKTVSTELEFSPEWGWGSSSTLISNLSQWLNLNPWQLLDNTLGGSGYDIACATAKGPIFYQREGKEKPVISPVNFEPAFEEQLWVVFLNQKQDTNHAIRHHQKETSKRKEWVQAASQISREFVRTTDPGYFMKLMDEHESIISRYTGLPRVQSEKFPDFPGQIKSLGAWGGDFILALSELQNDETRKYFQTKGYNILFKLSDIKHKHDEER